jgi:hypothetical protein
MVTVAASWGAKEAAAIHGVRRRAEEVASPYFLLRRQDRTSLIYKERSAKTDILQANHQSCHR